MTEFGSDGKGERGFTENDTGDGTLLHFNSEAGDPVARTLGDLPGLGDPEGDNMGTSVGPSDRNSFMLIVLMYCVEIEVILFYYLFIKVWC